MFGVAAVGGIVGGTYGVLHDLVTYAISPEYFTKFKFLQFHYADLGLGERAFAATIGFLATWWVGFAAAWFLARRYVPDQPRRRALKQVAGGFLCVLGFGLTFGAAGYAWGLWRGPAANYSAWAEMIYALEVTDTWAFVRVAYIHNAGYLGGLVGLVAALVAIRPQRIAP
jgi:hypothetical protein